MPMSPHKDESQSEFLGRCVPEMIGEGDDKRPRDQAVAICMDIWKNKDKEKQMRPMMDEDEEDFMGRCEAEGYDAEECAAMWDERGRAKHAPGAVNFRTIEKKGAGLEFILSDATPDRFGDVIIPEGWQLGNFRRNPIALFNHNPNFPIGKWRNLRVEDDALRGTLEMAPEGTSERIDEIRRLIEAGILRATSVGFTAIETKPRPEAKGDGVFYTKAELVETSLVSIPANPNALAIAKSLNISASTRELVFGPSAKMKAKSGGAESRGPSAEIHSRKKDKGMSNLSELVQAAQQKHVAAQDAFDSFSSQLDNDNVTDADLTKMREYTKAVTDTKNRLDTLIEAEQARAATAVPAQPTAPTVPRENGHAAPATRPFAQPKNKASAQDLFWRVGVIGVLAKATKAPPDLVRQRIFGDDTETKMIMDRCLIEGIDIFQRAASAPATTFTSGWADKLIQTVNADFVESIVPDSVYPRLSQLGQRYTFGRNGSITIPSRLSTPTVAGGFVLEGNPIPVKQGAFTSATLTPKKLAVITTMTREITEHSIPQIEGLLREAISNDTSVAIDTVLLDTNTATTIRPAGLLAGLTALTGSTSTGLAGILADMATLSGQLLTNLSGQLRRPVWIMNPVAANAVKLAASATSPGIFPFREEIMAGNLNGWPVISSGTVAAGTLILMDAYDFCTVTGDDPRWDISDQATLHMEDTTPAALSAVATPNTVAAPIRSLFQTDSLAIRMILPMNWTVRRTGTIVHLTSLAWD